MQTIDVRDLRMRYGTKDVLDGVTFQARRGEAVGLTAQRNTRIAQLSGGQRRRFDVAIGIVGRPEVLFLDEPTVGFDPAARREFHDLVHQMSDVDDTTVLLTTHDLDEAEKLADRIVILATGRVIADGSADELSRPVSGESEVRWTCEGARYVHAAGDATRFVRTCSGSTATRSPTWRCAAPVWRTRT
jgi:ABC-2 type transport system ATP-binding protein